MDVMNSFACFAKPVNVIPMAEKSFVFENYD